MKAEQLRRLLKGIVAGTLPALAILPSSACDVLGPIGYRCNYEEPTNKVLAEQTKPLSYQECLKLCYQVLKADSPNTTYFIKNPDGSKSSYPDGGPAIAPPGSSYVTLLSCAQHQPSKRYLCEYSKWIHCPVAGRRPAGLQENEVLGHVDEVGAYFAQMGYLEEAAVTAFRYLVEELKMHNAPVSFVQLAEEAVEEESEHAVMTKALARRYGATPLSVEVEPFEERSLFALALDNMVEGCVRETYGALSALWQSEHAEDEAVRAVTGRIVYEESRHAALSWELHAWLMPQLSASQRQACLDAKAQAIEELRESLAQEPPATLARIVGLPSSEEAMRMFQHCHATLWA